MWETLRLQEVRKTLKTNLEYGLNEQEAKIRLNQYGKNKLDEKKKESVREKSGADKAPARSASGVPGNDG